MRRKLACFVLLISASGLNAQPAPVLPADPPVPETRPELTPPTEAAPPAPERDDAQAPSDETAPQQPSAQQDTEEPAGRLTPPQAPSAEPPALSARETEACEAALREFGVTFERREPIDGAGGCGVASPYNVREIAPGVRLRPDTEMTCPTALALARWMDGMVLPATEALGEGVELTGITHASTYVCRSRNNQPGAKISEHATGTAIDVNSFDFEGREPIPIVPRRGEGDIVEAFQRAVRAGACLYFTTVLGPGSDEYHDNHLHLDIAERSRGFRLCQ